MSYTSQCTHKQKFRSHKQGLNESFADFLLSIKHLSQNCNFQGKSRFNEEIRNQIIFGIKNEDTQNYFLRTPNLTSDDVIKKAIADEEVNLGVSEFKNYNRSINKINFTDSKKLYTKNFTIQQNINLHSNNNAKYNYSANRSK